MNDLLCALLLPQPSYISEPHLTFNLIESLNAVLDFCCVFDNIDPFDICRTMK